MKLKKPITRAGFTRLAKEHDYLWNTKRPQVVDGITVAAAEGDRSENAEYIYGKKKLREVDRRIRYLELTLDEVQIVDPERIFRGTVSFGSTVKVEVHDGEDTKIMVMQIVGEGELQTGVVSVNWKSPLGRALMLKSVGDCFDLEVPGGERSYEVLEVSVPVVVPETAQVEGSKHAKGSKHAEGSTPEDDRDKS